MHVPDVDGQAEEGVMNASIKAVEPVECIDEHSRFGLESQGHVGPLGIPQDGLQGLGEPGHACLLVDREGWTSALLKEWDERLAGRVTYLMESLKLLEVDAEGGEAQIRSQNPTARAEQRGYYEVRLSRQGTLRMERFVVDETTRQRRPTPCQLTREVLERLADDITASVP